jgi:hypothetical protein
VIKYAPAIAASQSHRIMPRSSIALDPYLGSGKTPQ